MLTYTFSTREKVLLCLLALVGIGVVWYQLVFQNVQSQLATLDAQIANTQDEIAINQARAIQMNKMRSTIASYEEQGIEVVLLPSYDNTQNLMAYLNGVLGSAQDYTMSFDSPALDEDDGTIHRNGTISYTTTSYASARSIAEAIERGPFTCKVTALGIVDDALQRRTASSSSGTQTFSASLQVTFFEKAPANANVGTNKQESAGQDLSKLIDRDS